MSKIIDSLVQASIDSKNYSGVVLARLDFPTPYRYASSYDTIYWDEEGGGELAYTGVGHLGSISTLNESTEVQSQSIQVQISGIPLTAIAEGFDDQYIGKPLYVWYATVDRDTGAIEGGQAGPVLAFAGRMDFASITFGTTATISINATSRLSDWGRPRGGRFNQSYQQRHVDPTDTSFDYVKAIQNRKINWGADTISAGSGGTGGSGVRDGRNVVQR